MWAVVVVVVTPCRNQMAGMAQSWEKVLVQAFVEALDERILHRFAGRDVMPLDLTFLLPFEHGNRRQFGPVVAAGVIAVPAAAIMTGLIFLGLSAFFV